MENAHKIRSYIHPIIGVTSFFLPGFAMVTTLKDNEDFQFSINDLTTSTGSVTSVLTD